MTTSDITLNVALTGKIFLDIAPHGRFIATPAGYALAEAASRADLLAVVVQAYEDVGMPGEFDHAYWSQQRTMVLQVLAADLSLNSVALERENAEHLEDLRARIEDPIGYDAP